MQNNEKQIMCSVYFIILKLPQKMEEEMLFSIFGKLYCYSSPPWLLL